MSCIGSLKDFPENGSYSVDTALGPVLLVRHGEELYLYLNSCPHTRETLDPMGGSVAGEDGLLLTCQRHAAQFVTRTGECVGGPCQGDHLQAVPFTLSQGAIYLD